MQQRAFRLFFLFAISFYSLRMTARKTASGNVLDAGDGTQLVEMSVHMEHGETLGTATVIDGSFESAKQALSPGVTVDNESGMVGFNIDVNIRGISSINASQQSFSEILSFLTHVNNVSIRAHEALLLLALGSTDTTMPALPSRCLESSALQLLKV